MMKSLITIILLLGTLNSFGQIDTAKVNKEFRRLNGEIQSLKNDNNALSKHIQLLNTTFNKKSDSLQSQISSNTNNIQATANKLGFKIDESTNSSSRKIQDLNTSITSKSLYWIIGLLFTLALVTAIFLFLRKKISDGNSHLDQQITTAKKSLEEEGIRLDTKLTEVLDTQLKLLNEERSTPKSIPIVEDVDHSLALKVADEIVRIQKNLSNMEPTTKGLKQLAASVKRIQDNFEANGYEMVDLIGRPFDARIKVDAQFRPDDKLDKGQEIISRIIKPQVLYKGVMIQAGLVEVSQG